MTEPHILTPAELRALLPESEAIEELVALNCSPNLSNSSNSSVRELALNRGRRMGKASTKPAKAGKGTAPAETEAAFQAKVIQYARLRRWLVHHTRPAWSERGWSTPIQGNVGFMDAILARGACVIAVEFKSEKGKVSEAQAAWLAAFLAAGIPAFVWRPSDWDTIERTLE